MPGVGLIVASTFVSVIDEAKRFRNAHAVGAYLGLVLGEMTTGGPSKRRLGSITKQGNTMARVMLVQSAWLILRSRDVDDPLRRWAENIAKKRGRRIAVVALARKLAGVLWAMWRDGTVYDRATNASESARGVRRDARQQTHRADALEKAAKKLRRSAAPAAQKTWSQRLLSTKVAALLARRIWGRRLRAHGERERRFERGKPSLRGKRGFAREGSERLG